MTTIAWDGKILAADKMMTDGSFRATKTKIRQTPIGLMGASGDARYTAAAMDWVAKGDKTKPFPRGPKDDDVVHVLHVNLAGELDVYFDCGEPIRVECKHYALGSGRDFALAAMHLGHTAISAIQVASFLDVNTGNGLDALTLEGVCGSI